jgi:uncharacterized protein YxeA
MMKIFLIILAVLIVAFIIVQLFAVSGQRNIETYPYLVDEKYNEFEVRRYEASLFTSVKLSTNVYKEG